VSTEILRELGPACRNDERRALLVGAGALNGIDFVEYRQIPPPPGPPPLPPPRHVLAVHFLLPVAAGLYGLAADLSRILIFGGARIVDIRPLAVTAGAQATVIDIEVTAQGDFSNYGLALGWSRGSDGQWRFNLPGVDRQFSVAPVSFRADCPTDFDCAPVQDCPPERFIEPALDYLAKDYASFRQLLLDVLAQRNPRWLERNPADLGMALLELFAHEGDHLSYFQDAAANEAYLDTVRQRVSAKRHAKLIDYVVHDGRNAWTWAYAEVSADGVIPARTPLVTRVVAPLRNQEHPPATVIPDDPANPDVDFDTDPALARVRVFELATELRASVLNNRIQLHAWGNSECCLAPGTTTAHLYTVADAAPQQAVRPDIRVNDLLLFEEVLGPDTARRDGADVAAADADPLHRQVVRVVAIDDLVTDPLFDQTLLNGELQPAAGPNVLPLLEVTWRREDALSFPLCLTVLGPRDATIRVSVARGNLAVADHGRTVSESFAFDPPVAPDTAFRLRLTRGPLTMQCEPDEVTYGAAATLITPRPQLDCDVRQAHPAVALQVTIAGQNEIWSPVSDLLGSNAFHRHFVADVGNDGRATLRTGDGEYGREIAGATNVLARYRVGNGIAGNIGADGLAHVIVPVPVFPPGWPAITAIRNPLEARGGVDAETIEQVRQYAPAAFRARQFRAVTEADYRDAALTVDGVAGAVAWFRWTGSWYTVFIGIDPRDGEDLITESGGRTHLSEALERRVRARLERYRLAGYDLEIRSARYVPLDVTVELCVLPGHFRGDVAQAVRVALGSGIDRRGQRGFFDPSRFTFGQAVYLSRLYAAIEAVEGVDSAVVTGFHRFGRDPAGELASGVLPVGPWEIARLDNDPNRAENGVLAVTADGGK
jgi:hypothetical protein